jgi:hypothetical protein
MKTTVTKKVNAVKPVCNDLSEREQLPSTRSEEEADANAALIVKACNLFEAHEALAEAASLALTNDFKMEFRQRIMEALAALAQVRGQEGAKT